MDMALFYKIVDGIIKFPVQPKRILLTGVGEPLLNPQLSEMVLHLRNSGFDGRIDIQTNGTLLTPKRSLELIKAGVSKIMISVQALSSEKYEEVCGVKVDFNEFIDNIRWLNENKNNCEVSVKIIDANLNSEDEAEFYSIFNEICDSMFIEHLIYNQKQTSNFREDNGLNTTINMYNKPHVDIKTCPAVFYMMQILSDGSVYPCGTGSPARIQTIGNCNNQDLVDIWNGSIRYDLIMKMLKEGRPKIPFCNICDCVQVVYMDKVDEHTEDILAKFEKLRD